jgi:hypothetical protein
MVPHECPRAMLKKTSAGILEQSMGARNRVGTGLSYRPARLHRLAESIPGLLKGTVQRDGSGRN